MHSVLSLVQCSCMHSVLEHSDVCTIVGLCTCLESLLLVQSFLFHFLTFVPCLFILFQPWDGIHVRKEIDQALSRVSNALVVGFLFSLAVFCSLVLFPGVCTSGMVLPKKMVTCASILLRTTALSGMWFHRSVYTHLILAA